MIIIKRKNNETIDRMLRRYKRKHRDLKIKNEVLKRKQYEKPSTRRRKQVQKAIYNRQKLESYEL